MITTTAYIRISTDRQTLENQRLEIMRFASARGMPIDRWVEEVVSGKVKEKDRKLGQCVKRMREGDILIVSELSRLSRTLLEIMSIVRTLLEKGVIIYTVKENCCLGDNINSKVMMFAFGLVAEIERDLISMRTKEALAARKQQGVRLGRKNGDCPKIRMLEANGDDIRRLREAGYTLSSLSGKYGVSRSTMNKFLRQVKNS